MKNAAVGGVRGTWGGNLSWGAREEGLVLGLRRGWARAALPRRPADALAAGRGAGGRGMSLLLAPVPRLVDL